MRDTYGDLRSVFFGEENRTKIAAKFEHVKHLRHRGDVNLQKHSKFAGCSHVRIFLAIEISKKNAPKIAVNIAGVNGP